MPGTPGQSKQATFLLPARTRLAAAALPASLARALGRADALPRGDPGEQAQLLRHFELLPHGWPVAALTRALDANDAPLSAWLRADPAYVRPDINGARLLACGEALELDRRDADALLPALRPLFGDAGFPLDAPDPHRWYLRLPREARLPTFIAPADALGADLFDQLPGANDASPEGRRWRALLSEAQVVLHNHPHNVARIAAGRVPVNSLWFWGAGIAPDHVTTLHAAISGGDDLLQALGKAAGVRAAPAGDAFSVPDADTLVDLRGNRDATRLQAAWLLPAVAAVQRREIDRLVLDFEDGARFSLEPGQRWRFWRRPRQALAE